MNSGEFKASKEGGGGFNPTERLLELLMKGSPTIPQVQELIKQNANVNKCDEAGRGAALIWAVVKGVKLEVLEILLKASDDLGPSCIQNNNQNMTLLMFSIVTPSCTKRVKEAIVNRMVELKMHMNDVDRDQNTALVYAARYGNHELCEILIKYGAEVNKISDGFYGAKMTALDYALCNSVRRVLKNHGAKTYDELSGKQDSPRRVLSICYDYGGRSRSESRKRERSDSFELRTTSATNGGSSSPTTADSPRRPSPQPTNSTDSGNTGSWWTCSCVRPKGSQ